MIQDLRVACRSLLHARWYAASVLFVMAAGITLTALTFAIVDGVLFRSLPYTHADQLYLVRADTKSDPQLAPPAVSWDEVRVWREAVPDITIGVSRVTARREPQVEVRDFYVAEIDEHFLDVLGVQPLFGDFGGDDYSYQPPPGLSVYVQPRIISHSLWRALHNADPAIVGQTLVVSEMRGRQSALRVLGVLPGDFVFPVAYDQPQPDVLTPIRAFRTTRGRSSSEVRILQAIARVEDPRDVPRVRNRLLDATLEWAGVAHTALRIPGGTAELAPPFDQITLVPLTEHVGRQARSSFALVASAAGLLLALVCLNVAGLAAARTAERQRDLAVQRTLGATLWRLIRAQVAELGLLLLLACGLAVVACQPLLAWTVNLLPPELVPFRAPTVDVRVFAATVSVSVVSGLVVLLWPVRVALRTDLVSTLGRTSLGHSRRSGSSRVLIATHTAVGFVLLTAGALTATSLIAAWTEDTGYDRSHLALVDVSVTRFTTYEEARQQLEDVWRLLRTAPGVEDVAYSSLIQPVLLSTMPRPSTFWVPLSVTDDGAMTSGVASRFVSSNFFRVIRLEFVEGAWPDPAVWDQDGPVAVVSESAARHWWPGRSAVGQVVARIPVRERPSNVPKVVVGVVRDARYSALDRAPVPHIYVPNALNATNYGANFFVRTASSADIALPAITRAIAGHRMRVSQATTFDAGLFKSIRHRALPAWLFGLLGASGLLVLAVSMVGLLAMSVGQRRREIGIRLALGSTAPRIVGLLAREQLRPVTTGLIVGVLIAFWTTRFLESQLYGISAHHPAVWSATVLTVCTTAAVGAILPCIRSARMNPVSGLRTE